VHAPVNDESYLKKVSNKKSVQIMAAGGLEYVDDDYRASGHSPFTYFLLNELKSNERPLITVSELSGNVTRAVANNVEQTPESGVLQGAGDELGEFIFIRINVTAKGVAPENVGVEVKVVPADGTAGKAREIVVEPSGHEKQAPISKPYIPIPTL
jgi:hypothetical protein